MNPWDIHAAIFAKHAQHVVLIHFPIALCLTGVLFDAAAAFLRRKDLAAVAFWNLTIAAAAAVPTAITGLLAWQFELDGRRLKGILLFHLLAGSASVVLIWAVWYSHLRQRRQHDAPAPAYRWPLEALGVLAITLTGYLGGILSGVNHG
jgi:uncharacterized membrane protein